MASRVRIAIDCMGGDHGLEVSLPAALKALSTFSDLAITLVGDEEAIVQRLGLDASSFVIVHAPDLVSMSDKPAHALRKKTQSSMRIAIDLLEQKAVDAVVSAGNTGALMAIGCYVLKTLPGIDRPAICSAVPSTNGHAYLLDLGANVDCYAEHLYQFAIMGSALASVLDNNAQPRIALLNIGEEDIKGKEQVKLAGNLMEADSNLNYVGFAEGDALFSGEADVIVAEGFVGNVALKVCEGTARQIAHVVKQEFTSSWLSRLQAMLVRPVLRRIYRTLDPQRYNGASFLGLQGVVVKSHGDSSVDGFVNAIAHARKEVQSDLLSLIDKNLSELEDQRV